MAPEDYLYKAAESLESLETREEIDHLLDDLEFVFETLDPELQDLASGLIERLELRRRAL